MDKYIAAVRGGVRLEITGANPEKVISRCAGEGIELIRVEPTGDFTVEFTVRYKDAKKVYIISEYCMCTAVKKSEKGIPVFAKRIRKRLALIISPVLLILILLWSSLHIWEIRVTGNVLLSKGEILRALNNAGVKTGSYWPSFISDNIRSRVMVELPEIRWITVNVTGNRAEVLVRERVERPEIFDIREAVHVVAGKAGIITETRVYNGENKVMVGQTVAKGDIIVSGLVKSTYAAARTEHANADIWARTWHEMVMAAPISVYKKIPEETGNSNFSINCGDRRINFFYNSGKTGENYDKISVEHWLGVEGMISMPFSVIHHKVLPYTIRELELDASTVGERLRKELAQELMKQIGEDGEICSTFFSELEKDSVLYVTLRAECVENIAVSREMTYAELAAAGADLAGEGKLEDD